jgi:undecaprenyl-diphosphatase
MEQSTTLIAAFLGLLEGLTEFIPVSSTGHLLLAGHFLGFESAGRTFEVVIQLGAVLAILTVYSARLWAVFSAAPHDPQARRFIWSVLLAFLPAVFIGVLAHDFIKTVLFETPLLIAIMLVLGGVVLLIVDRIAPAPTYTDATKFPLSMAFKIGAVLVLTQIVCFLIYPNVDRKLGNLFPIAAGMLFFLVAPAVLVVYLGSRLRRTRAQEVDPA